MLNKTLICLATAAILSGTVTAAPFSAGSIEQPIATTQQPALSFSFPLYNTEVLDFTVQQAEAISDEFWFSVRGDQLNKGVELPISQGNALLRISRQSETATSLNVDQLQLIDTKGTNSVIQSKFSEAELQAVGIFNQDIAVRLSPGMKPAKMIAKYQGKLKAEDLYVIHVKEKNSPLTLSLNTKQQNYLAGENLEFSANLQHDGKILDAKVVTAYIKAPSGKILVGKTKLDDKGITFSKSNLNTVEAPVNGLYEAVLDLEHTSEAISVRRTAKVAFALAPQTAKIADIKSDVAGVKPVVAVNIDVNEPGRYEVRAVLFATTQEGTEKAVMETHTAQWLEVGLHNIEVQFDTEILTKSGLKGPYQIKHVRLKDQTRLSNLN